MKRIGSPGLWLLLGGLELLFFVHVAELIYPGYSVSKNMISDLAVGPTDPAIVFTAGLILFGVLAIVAGYQMRQDRVGSMLWLLVGLSGAGAIGVALVNENWIPPLHALFALIAFLFGNLAALLSYRLVPRPFAVICAVLGLIGLFALAMTAAEIDLGLGRGGMERMIFFPAMFWLIGYGVWLMSKEGGKESPRTPASGG
jgi:hypothetical membrane protein